MLKWKHNPEKLRWTFQRISGLQLAICVGIHFWVSIFKLGWPIRYEGLHALLSHPEWLVFYSIFLVLAVYHGFSGLWTVITDRNPSKTVKKTYKVILIVSGVLLIFLSEWNLILLGQ